MTSSKGPGKPPFVTIGRITSAHGLKGEVRIDPDTDFPDRYARGASVWLGDKPLTVQASRWDLKALLVKFEGIDDRDAAEGLIGSPLSAEARPDLADNSFYQHDIIGMTSVDAAGVELGRVT